MNRPTPYRNRRFAAGLFGLLAFWFQFIALAITPALASPAAFDPATGVVICTAHGIETLNQGQEPSSPPSNHLACACCVLGGCASACLASAGSTLVSSHDSILTTTPSLSDTVPRQNGRDANRQPRAPPVIA